MTSARSMTNAGSSEVDELANTARAARAAFAAWQHQPQVDRISVLQRVATELTRARETLARAMVGAIGKPLTQARAEVSRAVALIAAASRELQREPLTRLTSDGAEVVQRPHGVVAVITPWNNPVAIPVGKIAPALLFGNAVIWKPAPHAAGIARRLVDVFAAAGVPEGLVAVAFGDRDAALALIARPEVAAVTLSGSPAAGASVREAAAARSIPLQAELGGNNAAIVWSDCELGDAARQIAEGAMSFAGQRCTANRRVIVEASRYDRFGPQLERAVASLSWGDPADPATQVGPVVSAAARARVEALLERAAAGGARVVRPHVEAPSAEAHWVAPAVVYCDDPDDDIVQEETFGPVVVVQRAADEDTALELVNGVRQGLVASLFGGSREFRARFLAEARAGLLKLDRPTTGAGTEAPFGGWKGSGVGPPEHERGNRSFYTLTQTRYVPYGLEEIARRQPSRLAVCAPSPVTYAELDEAADGLARALAEAIPTPGARVALYLHPSADAVIALEALARAGLVAVPLDVRAPRERLLQILESAGCAALLSDLAGRVEARSLAGQIAVMDVTVRSSDPDATLPRQPFDSPAYLLFTSGTSGTPKGVIQTRANYAHTTRAYIRELAITPEDRVAVVASLAAGQGLTWTMTALTAGAAVAFWDLRNHGASELLEWVKTQRITLWSSTPTAFRVLFNALAPGEVLDDLRLVRLGGEAVGPDDVALWRRHAPRHAMLAQTLASTETGSIAQHVIRWDDPPPGDTIPVGRSIPGRDVLIVDDERRAVEPGQVGRLSVKSRWLSPGYWRDSARTRATFEDLPSGERIFFGQDLVRLNADGLLEHVGRADRQVKIRGARVALGEVESVLMEHPAVASAHVITRLVAGARQLLAYVVPRTGARPTLAVLRSHLRARLDDPAIPTLIIVPSLPLTGSGKLDRAALPEPAHAHPGGTPPRDPTEAAVAAVFASVLGVARLGIETHFFDAGGTSLQALRVIEELNRRIDVSITLDDLNAAPTVVALAATLSSGRRPEGGAMLRVRYGARPDQPVLVCFSGDVRPNPESKMEMIRLVSALGLDIDAVVVSPVSVVATSMEDIAAHIASELQERFVDRRFTLLGHCLGGFTAFAVARRLSRPDPTSVAEVILVDTPAPTDARRRRYRTHYTRFRPGREFGTFLLERFDHHLTHLRELPPDRRARYLIGRVRAATRWARNTMTPGALRPRPAAEANPTTDEHEVRYGLALASYVPQALEHAGHWIVTRREDALAWAALFEGGLTLHAFDSSHYALYGSELARTAELVRELIA